MSFVRLLKVIEGLSTQPTKIKACMRKARSTPGSDRELVHEAIMKANGNNWTLVSNACHCYLAALDWYNKLGAKEKRGFNLHSMWRIALIKFAYSDIPIQLAINETKAHFKKWDENPKSVRNFQEVFAGP